MGVHDVLFSLQHLFASLTVPKSDNRISAPLLSLQYEQNQDIVDSTEASPHHLIIVINRRIIVDSTDVLTQRILEVHSTQDMLNNPQRNSNDTRIFVDSKQKRLIFFH